MKERGRVAHVSNERGGLSYMSVSCEIATRRVDESVRLFPSFCIA